MFVYGSNEVGLKQYYYVYIFHKMRIHFKRFISNVQSFLIDLSGSGECLNGGSCLIKSCDCTAVGSTGNICGNKSEFTYVRT